LGRGIEGLLKKKAAVLGLRGGNGMRKIQVVVNVNASRDVGFWGWVTHVVKSMTNAPQKGSGKKVL